MTEASFRDASFDAVVAFYSIIHVPRDEQPGLLRRVAGWLRPGGRFVGNFGTGNEADEYLTRGSTTSTCTGVPSTPRPRYATSKAQVFGSSALRFSHFEDGRIARFLWVWAVRP